MKTLLIIKIGLEVLNEKKNKLNEFSLNIILILLIHFLDLFLGLYFPTTFFVNSNN